MTRPSHEWQTNASSTGFETESKDNRSLLQLAGAIACVTLSHFHLFKKTKCCIGNLKAGIYYIQGMAIRRRRSRRLDNRPHMHCATIEQLVMKGLTSFSVLDEGCCGAKNGTM